MMKKKQQKNLKSHENVEYFQHENRVNDILVVGVTVVRLVRGYRCMRVSVKCQKDSCELRVNNQFITYTGTLMRYIEAVIKNKNFKMFDMDLKCWSVFHVFDFDLGLKALHFGRLYANVV